MTRATPERVAAVDDALSDTSTNPVENRVVTGAIRALQIEDTVSGAIVSITDGSANPIQSLSVSLSPIQEGSGDPSPDNVRPITGRDSVTVERTGKNLFDNAKWSQAESYPNTGNYGYKLTDPIYLAPNTQYAYKPTGSGSVVNVSYYNIWVYSGDGVGISDTHTEYRLINNGTISTGGTFTTGSTGAIRLAVNVSASYTLEDRLSYIYAATRFQIEVGSTATAYEPYDGTSVTVQLGQTVYGGTVDVTGGKITVTRKVYNLSDLSFAYYSNGGYFRSPQLTTVKKGFNNVVTTMICNMLKGTAPNNIQDLSCNLTTDTNPRIVVRDVSLDGSLENFNEKYADAVFVCEMKEPFDIDLTPASLSTLRGDNTVWSDGDKVTMIYIADPKLYIDKKITAAVAALA